MKYLFFFVIQDFVQEDRQKYIKKLQKYCQFYRRKYRRHGTRRYYTESWKTITEFYHNHRRVHRRTGTPVGILQRIEKKYGILPLSPMAIPTNWYSSVFDRELHIITVLAIITDGFTDGWCTSLSARLSNPLVSRHSYQCACALTHVSRRTEKSGGIFKIFGVNIN
jgi:hypothetical protein